MKLKFLIDPKYVFLHAFNQDQRKEPFRGWGNFTMKIWDKYPQECYLLAGYAEWPIIKKSSLSITANNAEKLLNAWLKTPQARKLIKETEKYRDWLEKEWSKKKEKTLNELEKIIRIPLPNKTISVYITHPKLNNGMTINTATITWGHSEDWENYSIVYLCHEIMHILFWNIKSPISHGAIELATDNELRIKLNGRGKYFKEGKLDIGHKKLKEIEQKLLPRWNKYLKNPKINIKQFVQKQKEISD
jgi:hypothetical protein